MPRKRIWIAGAVAVLVLAVLAGGLAVALNQRSASEEIYYQYGQIEREKLDTMDAQAVVLEANSFTIPAAELTAVAAQEQLSGLSETEAYASAEQILVEKYTMYHLALESGVEPDPAGVRENLEYNREISKQAGNYADFQSFLDGIGMTHDEYWDSQYENFLIYDVIARYKQQLHETWLSSTAQPDAADPADTEAAWEAWYAAYVAEAVQDENVHAVV